MTCCPSGKIGYPTAADAWKVLQLQGSPRWKKSHKAPLINGNYAYQCLLCQHWHITRPRKNHRAPEKRLSERKALRRPLSVAHVWEEMQA